MPNLTDVKITNLGAGFTIGFGIWTVWTALKQTMAHRRPSHSVYIYMIWGEITSNIAIAVLAWLYFNSNIKPGVPIYFFITFFWVFQIHLLMQIIINRVAVVVSNRDTIRKIKWGTAAILVAINISVFIIWIPSQLEPPPIPVLVEINKYWDRTSKGIILLIDAGLNLYFLRNVQTHLIKEHGLVKYKPLVRFNARLMVVSIAMDAMLIILESLPGRGLIFEQFHPVAYMVKLNIEMSMAALIAKIARGSINNLNEIWYHTRLGGSPPEYNYSTTRLPNRSLENPGPDALNLPDWPIAICGTTYTNATGPDSIPTKSREMNNSNNITASHEMSGESDVEITGGGGGRISTDENSRTKFGIAALGRKLSFKVNGNTGSSISVNTEMQKSKEVIGGVNVDEGIVRTTEVEIRIEEMVRGDFLGRGGSVRERERDRFREREKVSRIGDDGDYIGRARNED